MGRQRYINVSVHLESSTHYFGAGPAALPLAVKQQIQTDVIQYKNSPVSILELSHRANEFSEILDQASQILRELYSIPDHYHIIYMHGGATAQFDAVPLNLLSGAKKMSYVDTGMWSRRAAQFAQKYGEVKVINGLIDNEDEIRCVPSDQWEIDPASAYVHVTPNETIDGIAQKDVFTMQIPVVADMTSCLLMKWFDINDYGLIYAGTQKTLGIAGLTVVIVHNDLLDRVTEQTPWLYRYDAHVREHSKVNTTPVFACYVTQLMLEWVRQNGGIKVMVEQAQLRANLLYQTIDKYSNIINKIASSNRSNINVVFDFPKSATLEKFLHSAEHIGLYGLKGHRLIGGVRASMYNGTPMAAVEKLNKLLQETGS